MIKFTIPVRPRTKKNHSSIVTLKNGRTLLLPSKPYKEFEKSVCDFIKGQIKLSKPISKPINLRCIFYKEKNYKSDLMGYMQAIADALVKAKLLADDNSSIVVSTDGSRVLLDRLNPRIEVEINFLEGGKLRNMEDEIINREE